MCSCRVDRQDLSTFLACLWSNKDRSNITARFTLHGVTYARKADVQSPFVKHVGISVNGQAVISSLFVASFIFQVGKRDRKKQERIMIRKTEQEGKEECLTSCNAALASFSFISVSSSAITLSYLNASPIILSLSLPDSCSDCVSRSLLLTPSFCFSLFDQQPKRWHRSLANTQLAARIDWHYRTLMWNVTYIWIRIRTFSLSLYKCTRTYIAATVYDKTT